MDMLTDMVIGTIPQCVHMSNHHAVHFKYIILLIQKIKRNIVNNNNKNGAEEIQNV